MTPDEAVIAVLIKIAEKWTDEAGAKDAEFRRLAEQGKHLDALEPMYRSREQIERARELFNHARALSGQQALELTEPAAQPPAASEPVARTACRNDRPDPRPREPRAGREPSTRDFMDAAERG